MVSKNVTALCAEQNLTHTAIVRVLVKSRSRDASTLTLEYYQERLQTIKEYADSVNKIHSKLLAEVTEEIRPGILYFSSDQYEAILDAIDEATEYFLDNINRIHSTRTTALAMSPAQTMSSSLNLPKLQFPKFSGNYEDWSNFSDLFKSAIHSNQSIPNAQKLQYLKSSLTGEAYEIIKTYAITDDNYASAWSSLSDRFENKRIIKTALLNKLFVLPPVSNSNLSGLRKLFDTYKQVTESMKNLCSPITNDSPLLVHLIVQRFDMSLKRDWEVSIADEADFPTLTLLDKFLLNKVRTLEAMSLNTSGSSKERASSKPMKFNSFNTTKRESFESCPVCHGKHRLYTCDKLLGMSTSNRYQFVSNARRCINCLALGHRAAECKSKFRCRRCSQRHHSLLHVDKGPNKDSNTKQNTSSSPQVNAHLNSSKQPEVLLATALITAIAPNGNSMPVRALLDIGLETSFVSEKIAQHLQLPRYMANVSVAGIGGNLTASLKHSTTFHVNTLNVRRNSLPVSAYILPKLTAYSPKAFNPAKHPELRGIKLADPLSPNSGKVDVILGADVYGEIIQEGIIKLSNSKVIAQNTKFGWVLSGPTAKPTRHVITAQVSNLEISQLENFWKVEEVPTTTVTKEEDEYCEEHFLKTYRRDATGRFIVKLPFKRDFNLNELGESKHRALGSYNRLQSQFARGKSEYEQYENFMEEYEQLGHMQKVRDSGDRRIYLPHHAVIKEHSTSTKLRVVFNASCHTSTGKSLNDALCAGPKLQNDIVSILTNWRFYPYVVVADIEKMFRQILISEEDRKFQCILWSKIGASHPDTFELNTVTYGTTSAPYLAMRAIKQLLDEDGSEFPVAAELVKKQIYVDDILIGAYTIPALIKLKAQTITLLEKGGFILKKWASNRPELLTERATGDVIIQSTESPEQKVLGISWNPAEDKFTVKSSTVNNSHVTKRFLLSTIGKLFDPLGWLSPIIVKAKILMQELWVTGLNWDDPLPNHLREKWITLCDEFPKLEEISIPRWVHVDISNANLQLVGFCDASRQAYSAAVYLRNLDSKGDIHTSLLIAKTKVAPLKTLSIPRLELCGAVLLTKLIDYVTTNLSHPIEKIFCFTDSKIVLSWLARTPSHWTVYVANRISFIQTTLPNTEWFHVTTGENCADLNSRGVTAEKLSTSTLWWHRTHFHLCRETPEETTEETRTRAVTVLFQHPKPIPFFSKFSTWTKTLNITAYVIKFISLCKKSKRTKNSTHNLIREDVDRATHTILKDVQDELYSQEISNLQKGGNVPLNSQLSKFSPFLDENGILRVGGRLDWAEGLTFDQRHPILLGKHHVTKLIIKYYHLSALHAGLQLTLQLIRNKYWIINARNLTKSVIHDCVTCARHAAKLECEKMSSLPQTRCTPSRAFSHVGVDYAGPFSITTTAGRGHHTSKMYIALFVCFSTRAIHLEVVTNYATSGFMAAFHRFVARRGFPDTIYSDNGTNFQGANSELRKSFKTALRDPNLHNYFSQENIQWQFIPPSAPHFGGLWEAGVKSVKHHLKRMIGKFTPTLEEFSTLLCRIEACLNSRPLCKLGDEPEDLNSLTPGHFNRKFTESSTGTVVFRACGKSTISLANHFKNHSELLEKMEL